MNSAFQTFIEKRSSSSQQSPKLSAFAERMHNRTHSLYLIDVFLQVQVLVIDAFEGVRRRDFALARINKIRMLSFLMKQLFS